MPNTMSFSPIHSHVMLTNQSYFQPEQSSVVYPVLPHTSSIIDGFLQADEENGDL